MSTQAQRVLVTGWPSFLHGEATAPLRAGRPDSRAGNRLQHTSLSWLLR